MPTNTLVKSQLSITVARTAGQSESLISQSCETREHHDALKDARSMSFHKWKQVQGSNEMFQRVAGILTMLESDQEGNLAEMITQALKYVRL